jgi:tRNA G18 (ribose-2'-O)-methylase SpoU
MAATLAVPFADAGSWPGAIHTLRAHGLRVLALTPSADAIAIDDLPPDLERGAILVGAEGDGLSAEAMAAADHRVRIPMSGPADSLNVTIAASVALFALSRKR